MTKQVFWAVLLERNPSGASISTVIDVAMEAGRMGYRRLTVPYARTDFVRNALADEFMRLSSDPSDTLIMLDDDHAHHPQTLQWLASLDLPVVGALAFRRGPPYDACAFIRGDDRKLHGLETWPEGEIFPTDMVGHAAIAIQRRVFTQLVEKGHDKPWWQYIYNEGNLSMPSEDMYFGYICEVSGIRHYVDSSLIPPHLTNGWIDHDSHKSWMADHPEELTTAATVTQVNAPPAVEERDTVAEAV